MSLRVKICGITNLADAEAAVEAGADALGFIIYKKSPRYIGADDAQKIIEILPPFVERVAVLVNPTLEEVNEVETEADFSLWQMHGQETADFCASLAPHRLVKALHLPTSHSASDLANYDVAAFLLDTPSPQHGGTGQTFDWDLVEAFRPLTPRPIILSGGLNAGNVAEAVKRVQPYAVDICSGVERAPGQKDHSKIRELLNICRAL